MDISLSGLLEVRVICEQIIQLNIQLRFLVDKIADTLLLTRCRPPRPGHAQGSAGHPS